MAMIAALGLSMASAPVLAQTAPTARTGAEMVQASAQDDGDDWGTGTSTTTYIIAFFVVIVIGLGIYFAVDKDDGPTTP
jgi:cobalamin synthase